MRFTSIIFPALLAALAASAPTPQQQGAQPGSQPGNQSGGQPGGQPGNQQPNPQPHPHPQTPQQQLDGLKGKGCNVPLCLAASASQSVACSTALAFAGFNVIADIACFTSLAGHNVGIACHGCL